MSNKLKIISVFILTSIFVLAIFNIRLVATGTQFLLSKVDASDQETHLFPTQGPKENSVLSQSANLIINKIGISAPIIFGTADNNDAIFKNLEKGVVHYSATTKPGQNGTSVILGHSSAYPWYKGNYGSVFAMIGTLQPGDNFFVRYDDGKTFTYVVKKSIIFSPKTNDPRVTELQNNTEPTLVLITCWPIGTNYKRIAVEAILVTH